MCARTGWTWRYVWSELDMDQIDALMQHWDRQPPVDLTAAAWVGHKPRPRATAHERNGVVAAAGKDQPQKWNELRALFPQGVIRG